MQRAKQCKIFDTLGSDIKNSRQILNMSRKDLAEKLNIDPRYLANIENSGSLPSLPIFYELIQVCRLPVEQYFFPQKNRGENQQYHRALNKLKLCPEQYLSIIEAAIDSAIRINDADEE